MTQGSAEGDAGVERERSLALLEGQHTFPGPFTFRVVVEPLLRADVVSAVSAVAGGVSKVDERPSRNGTYVSLRIAVQADSAEQVLEVYDVLKRIDGVRAVL